MPRSFSRSPAVSPSGIPTDSELPLTVPWLKIVGCRVQGFRGKGLGVEGFRV